MKKKAKTYTVPFVFPKSTQRPKVGDTVMLPSIRESLPKRRAKVIKVYPTYVLCDVGNYKECLNV